MDERIKHYWVDKTVDLVFKSLNHEGIEDEGLDTESTIDFLMTTIEFFDKKRVREETRKLPIEELMVVYGEVFNLVVDKLNEKAKQEGFSSFNDILYHDDEGPIENNKVVFERS